MFHFTFLNLRRIEAISKEKTPKIENLTTNVGLFSTAHTAKNLDLFCALGPFSAHDLITVFGSWSLGCSRLLLAAPAVRLLGLLLAASLLLACCWLLVADGCCSSSREQPIRQLPNTVVLAAML